MQDATPAEKTTAVAEIAWWEPRWSYVGRLRRDYADVFFNSRTLIRVGTVGVVLCIAIAVAFKVAFPLIVLPKVWQFMLVLVAMPLFLAAHFVLQLAIPTYVVCRRGKAITIQSGQSARVIKPEWVTTTRLVFHPEQRIRLQLVYQPPKGPRRVRTIGLAPNVDLEQLCELLPVSPRIDDARDRVLPLRKVAKT